MVTVTVMVMVMVTAAAGGVPDSRGIAHFPSLRKRGKAAENSALRREHEPGRPGVRED